MPSDAAVSAQAAAWARRVVPGSGPVDLQAMGTGLVNDTFCVTRDGARYGLRLGSATVHALGREPQWELRVLAVAAAAGIAPQIVHYDADAGVLVTRWTPGEAWDLAQARLPINLERMAHVLRQVHALRVPLPHREMSAAGWIRLYEDALAERAAHVEVRTARSAALRSAALDCSRRLVDLGNRSSVLCHSDLHALNLLDSNGRLVLLDWEYAHFTEALWDTAAWISNNDLDESAATRFLHAYHDRPLTLAESERQRLLCWAFDYVCLLWSELYQVLRGSCDSVEYRANQLAARLAKQTWS